MEADIFASPELLSEYRSVPLALEAEGKITHPQFKSLIAGIAAFVANAKVVQPRKGLTICRDPKDNMVLESCLASKADILITGDNDLLEIETLPFGLKILSPKDYVENG